jgi:hypothetical protein
MGQWEKFGLKFRTSVITFMTINIFKQITKKITIVQKMEYRNKLLIIYIWEF